MRRSYKKNMVADSPAIQEHEQIMQQVEQNAAVVHQSRKGVKPTGVFSQYSQQGVKKVKTRIPFAMYEQLNRIKMQSQQEGNSLSIGDIVLKAIEEYLKVHG